MPRTKSVFDKDPNPVMFNPVDMSINDVIRCATTMHTIYNMILNDIDAESIKIFASQCLDYHRKVFAHVD